MKLTVSFDLRKIHCNCGGELKTLTHSRTVTCYCVKCKKSCDYSSFLEREKAESVVKINYLVNEVKKLGPTKVEVQHE